MSHRTKKGHGIKLLRDSLVVGKLILMMMMMMMVVVVVVEKEEQKN